MAGTLRPARQKIEFSEKRPRKRSSFVLLNLNAIFALIASALANFSSIPPPPPHLSPIPIVHFFKADQQSQPHVRQLMPSSNFPWVMSNEAYLWRPFWESSKDTRKWRCWWLLGEGNCLFPREVTVKVFDLFCVCVCEFPGILSVSFLSALKCQFVVVSYSSW